MPSQPRHTETSILHSYLLPPSPLPTVLPYNAFLQLVPTQHRAHPHLKRLYRDLQFQRNVDVDTVRQNIAREVSRGVTLKSQLAKRVAEELDSRKRTGEQRTTKKRKRDGNDNHDELTDEITIAIDTTYHHASLHPSHNSTLTSTSSHPLTSSTLRHHTSSTLLQSLHSASSTLSTEITELETESSALLAEMTEIVGSLSDLRYGRFARPVSGEGVDGEEKMTVEDEIREALEGLERRIVSVTDRERTGAG